jgi:predicted regulator of Ras-like GTPase activity (Roadblock/LC7/MglB family)
MTGTATATQARKQAEQLLDELCTSIDFVNGALLASLDGNPLAAKLIDHEPRSTAAIVASSKGLGDRLAELAGASGLEEIVVRSGSGYVVIYTVEGKGALTVLTRPAVNLALLHLKARDATVELGKAIDAMQIH